MSVLLLFFTLSASSASPWQLLVPTPAPFELAGSASSSRTGTMFVVGGCSSATCTTGASSLIIMRTAATNASAAPVVTWSRSRAELQVPRIGLGAALMDNLLFAVGGLDTHTNSTLATVEVLDVSSSDSNWASVRSMPTARWLLAVASFDGRVFAVGGQTGGYQSGGTCEAVESYCPRTDTWVREAPLQQARSGLGMVVINGGLLLVVVGGQTAVEHVDPGDRVLNSTEVFDRVKRRWKRCPECALQQPRVAHALVAVPGVIGGWATILALGGGNAEFVHIGSVETLRVYVGGAEEPAGSHNSHDVWLGDAAGRPRVPPVPPVLPQPQLQLHLPRVVPAMPGARAGAAVGIFHNDEIIIAGGVDAQYNVLNSTIAYVLGATVAP